MNLTEIQVPKNLRCVVCGAPFNNASAVRSAPKPKFVVGTIVICTECSTPNVLTPTGMKQMTAEEINRLSQESKSAIMMTKLAIVRILEKKKRLLTK